MRLRLGRGVDRQESPDESSDVAGSVAMISKAALPQAARLGTSFTHLDGHCRPRPCRPKPHSQDSSMQGEAYSAWHQHPRETVSGQPSA